MHTRATKRDDELAKKHKYPIERKTMETQNVDYEMYVRSRG